MQNNLLKEPESSWRSAVDGDHSSVEGLCWRLEKIILDAKMGWQNLGASGKCLLFYTSLKN